MRKIGGALTRFLFLSGSIAALGLIALYQDDDQNWSSARAQPFIATNDLVEAQGLQVVPAVYREAASTASTCNSWDVSPIVMEAILDEMIRRGWRPPTQAGDPSLLNASLYGLEMEAVDPAGEAGIGSRGHNPIPPTPELHQAEGQLPLEASATVVEAAAVDAVVDVTSEPSTGATTPASAPTDEEL